MRDRIVSKEALEFFAGLNDGDRFTAFFPRLFDDEVTSQKYTYGGEVEKHGYRDQGGGWGLYWIDGAVQSYHVKVRRYRERKWRWLRLDEVLALYPGWGETMEKAS